MATRAQDIVDGALRGIGVLAGGATASGSMLQDALKAGNLLLRSWEGMGLAGWIRATGTFSLVSGTQSYTMGASGTGLTTRPTEVFDCYVKDADGNETRLYKLSREDYLGITLKTDPGTPPTRFYYDPQVTSGVLYLYPVIDQSGWTLTLDYRKPLTELSAGSDTLDMPPEMERAFKWNLAVEVAPEYQMQVPDAVARQAQESLMLAFGTVKRLGAQPIFGWVDEEV